MKYLLKYLLVLVIMALLVLVIMVIMATSSPSGKEAKIGEGYTITDEGYALITDAFREVGWSTSDLPEFARILASLPDYGAVDSKP